jgi:deazaflavin-dependent oxidoreductase (nitroreductase family)
MPSDTALKLMNLVHRTAIRGSGGRLGWSVGKLPIIELTTIGRRSGEPRTVILLSPVQEGDTFVIVASRGGDDRHPAWFHNLSANPDVEVASKGRSKRTMSARVAAPDERAGLWPQVVAAYKSYGGYQERTERVIPVVLLEPVA